MTGKKAEAHLEAKFFRDAATFRRWLEKYHDRKDELWMGYYKKGSGKGGLTYMDALDEALCFGWIDGITKSIDDERYSQRWTPRRPTSIWSERNIDKVKKLTAEGRMTDAGLAAFQQRSAEKSGVYSFEQEKVELTPEFELRLRSRKFEELLRASTAETWVGPLQRDRERKK
jgi:uncharacterized protein YdeI (YjbR/CyaY-like superfamily)